MTTHNCCRIYLNLRISCYIGHGTVRSRHSYPNEPYQLELENENRVQACTNIYSDLPRAITIDGSIDCSAREQLSRGLGSERGKTDRTVQLAYSKSMDTDDSIHPMKKY